MAACRRVGARRRRAGRDLQATIARNAASSSVVANYGGVEALENDGGAILFRHTGERVSLHWLNGPEGDPFNAAIESLGGTRAWRQHELLLRL